MSLLGAGGCDLEMGPALGEGMDRSLIRELLAMSPTERIAGLTEEARFPDVLDVARRSSTAARGWAHAWRRAYLAIWARSGRPSGRPCRRVAVGADGPASM